MYLILMQHKLQKTHNFAVKEGKKEENFPKKQEKNL